MLLDDVGVGPVVLDLGITAEPMQHDDRDMWTQIFIYFRIEFDMEERLQLTQECHLSDVGGAKENPMRRLLEIRSFGGENSANRLFLLLIFVIVAMDENKDITNLR